MLFVRNGNYSITICQKITRFFYTVLQFTLAFQSWRQQNQSLTQDNLLIHIPKHFMMLLHLMSLEIFLQTTMKTKTGQPRYSMKTGKGNLTDQSHGTVKQLSFDGSYTRTIQKHKSYQSRPMGQGAMFTVSKRGLWRGLPSPPPLSYHSLYLPQTPMQSFTNTATLLLTADTLMKHYYLCPPSIPNIHSQSPTHTIHSDTCTTHCLLFAVCYSQGTLFNYAQISNLPH